MTWRLSPAAEADLIAIYRDGLRLSGESQADRYWDQPERSFELRAAHPLIARERMEIVPPVRVHPVGSHLVVYLAEADGPAATVRVRHAREDWIEDPI